MTYEEVDKFCRENNLEISYEAVRFITKIASRKIESAQELSVDLVLQLAKVFENLKN